LALEGEWIHGRQGSQRGHVGRGLHRRTRADERSNIHRHDPGHEDDPG
jgi:hypothetical protein